MKYMKVFMSWKVWSIRKYAWFGKYELSERMHDYESMKDQKVWLGGPESMHNKESIHDYESTKNQKVSMIIKVRSIRKYAWLWKYEGSESMHD